MILDDMPWRQRKNFPQRKIIRWNKWNYAWPGYYFVTICTKWMRPWFGEIKNGEMELSILGEIIKEEWLKTKLIRKNIIIDEWIIMPNHFHAIIIIRNMERAEGEIAKGNAPISRLDANTVRADCNPPVPARENRNLPASQIQYRNKFGPQRNNLGAIIRGFKGASFRRIHALGYKEFFWHRSFNDKIIKDEFALHNIRKYIRNNPKNWGKK